MRYKIVLSYDGSAFCGWQIQNNGETIQGCLQKALSTLLNDNIQVTGAGRTDSNVNAMNYVAHFDHPNESLCASGLSYKINAILPRGIVVHAIESVSPEFHARFDAKMREYKYFIHRKKDPFNGRYSYQYSYNISVDKMNQAADMLLGKHDFKCFEKVGSDNKTSICTVTLAKWEAYVPEHVSILGYPAAEGDYLVFTIRADRFLRNMVRAVVGSLLDVGRGRHEPEWINELLDGGTRSDAGESVPGNALFLTDVKY